MLVGVHVNELEFVNTEKLEKKKRSRKGCVLLAFFIPGVSLNFNVSLMALRLCLRHESKLLI